MPLYDDPELTPEEIDRLRRVRERELARPSHYTSQGVPDELRRRIGWCQHCGDPACCRESGGTACCRLCWLELEHGMIPPPYFLSNAPKKPGNVFVRRLQRMPSDADADYFGRHDGDVDTPDGG